ncbi:MAG: restriction endonuclease [Acidobacteria bacterium]|nr:MAG: restriction endonuclease [Acidobacteriota bacterium]REK06221.1 MAG: restriction endonuclease [Acidobacteriota bacterium]
MSDDFFRSPILNNPYERPGAYWELDDDGQPTGVKKKGRRPSSNVTPVPKPKKRKLAKQVELDQGAESDEQRYDVNRTINDIRNRVDAWRQLNNPHDWRVTPETARLLQHWRHHRFASIRPFFCQVEAVETAIWLAEVAPKLDKGSRDLVAGLREANQEANPELFRIALKLATGAGKTTVMAMLIAWQTINAIRHPGSKQFSRAFLVVTPGITIKDRLRVLLPNDANEYYGSRELVPQDLHRELLRAKIVITNYHAFKLREKTQLAAGTRRMLEGRDGKLDTLESEGQMVQRVMGELMGLRGIVVLNDEAHHCYREKPESDEGKLTGDARKEANENAEAARLWINGIEAVKRKLGVGTVYDLSATPFFLSGSGYAEGTLFPWTACDFSLMDAIESGIVKLPRVPIADNISGEDAPRYRRLWDHIGKRMPKKGRGKSGAYDPSKLPTELTTALEALYGHYAKTFEQWVDAGIEVPPVFIVVCNNTTTSKLVYDYVSGFVRQTKDGDLFVPGALELFRNFDEHGNPIPRPRTLLIDSHQLESGEGIDKNFRDAASAEIDQFRREITQREGSGGADRTISDEELLREVMNTVGQQNRLGESIRCVVSVSMLTEGWDANTVTHVLGVRAFGTQLLCEQVVGRALRRQSYELNEENRFDVEYADVLGVPFDFTAKPVVAPPQRPAQITRVRAVSPERDHLEIRFPRVSGYRVELPETELRADFTEDSKLVLTPDLVGATKTENAGIIGEITTLSVDHLEDVRKSQVLFELAAHLIYNHMRDPDGAARYDLFHQVKRIAKVWLDEHLECQGGTYPALLLRQELAEMACERIHAAITEAHRGERRMTAVLDPYNPEVSTRVVNFTTSKDTLWKTSPQSSHVDWVVCDSDWEAEFCRVAEGHSQVVAYVKNHGLQFVVPYRFGGNARQYWPDFILLVADRPDSPDDLLHLVVEVKGYRGEDAKEKANTMRTFWVPGVNNARSFGRWQFAEFTNVYEIESAFSDLIEKAIAESESS